MSRDVYEHKHTFEVIPPLPQEQLAKIHGLHFEEMTIEEAADRYQLTPEQVQKLKDIQNGTTNNNK
jgi:hypothetical protein